ncbi:MAG TPA: glutathione S-transferase family protein [Woeseiaceae bacterium]
MTVKLVIGNRNYSSWSLRSWLLLAEAGIEFDEHRIALDAPGTADELKRYTPAARVPVLLLDGYAVWDSMAIAETVAERWPERKLWPDDPRTRAHARSISAEMHAGFLALREAMPMNCRAEGRKVPLSAALTADTDRIFAIWADCHRLYGRHGDWLFGRFSIADAMYAPVVLRFRSYGVSTPKEAGVYPARLLESPAMQKWLAAAVTETEVIEKEEIGQ